MIINAKFTSVWADECEILEYEYVEFGDGKKLHRFPVYSKEVKDFNKEAYWRAN